MKKNKDLLSEYAASLERSFNEWDRLYNYGGSDPFWADGMNLSLVRNHILSDKRQIKEFIENEQDSQTSMFKNSFPEIYFRETPPEIDMEYMAIPNRILDKAISFVNKIVEEPGYIFVLEHFDEVFPDKKEDAVTKQFEVPFIPAWQLTSYPEKIKSGNIIDLRRTFYFTDYDKKVEEINRIADKMKQVLALSQEEREEILNKKKNKTVNDEFEDIDSEEITDEAMSLSEQKETSEKQSFDDLVVAAENKRTPAKNASPQREIEENQI